MARDLNSLFDSVNKQFSNLIKPAKLGSNLFN
jgi:hypothetical protein